MFGNNDDREEIAREERQKQREHSIHGQNLGAGGNEWSEQDKAEVLSQLSEIDDLPYSDDDGDEILSQLTSQIASTTNISEEDVRSKEWVFEIIRELHLQRYPPEYGMRGYFRAYVKDDASAYRQPLDDDEEARVEAFLDNAKRVLTRSEEAKVIEESTRSVSESVLRDKTEESSGSGGLLGRFRG